MAKLMAWVMLSVSNFLRTLICDSSYHVVYDKEILNPRHGMIYLSP